MVQVTGVLSKVESCQRLMLPCLKLNIIISYLPTPPFGQDMTRGQFNRFEFGVFLLLDLLPHQGWRTQSVLLLTHSWRENNWIYTFRKGISAMWNAISLVQDYKAQINGNRNNPRKGVAPFPTLSSRPWLSANLILKYKQYLALNNPQGSICH